jgi:hypothetical protein
MPSPHVLHRFSIHACWSAAWQGPRVDVLPRPVDEMRRDDRLWPGGDWIRSCLNSAVTGVLAAGWVVLAMRRFGVIVALGALLGMLGGAVAASPALARGPGWQFLPATAFTFDPSPCAFGVQDTPVVDKEYAKVLKAADGSMTFLVTGFIEVSFTNLSTGKTIFENTSGPGKATLNGDGSMTLALKGHTAMVLTPADAQRFGLPTLFVSAGALTESLDPDGNITSLSLNGHVLVDVCAALS